MLRLYYADLSALAAETAETPLSAYRAEKLGKTAAPRRRREMLGAEWLLNRAVREWDPAVSLPLSIRTREAGKPYLADLPVFFSLSHSWPYAACALAACEIGLDIQRRAAPRAALLRRCFSAEERRYIEAAPAPDAAFTELWSLKESYVKALGVGLGLPFSSLSFEMTEPRRLREDAAARFWTASTDAFALSLCTLDGSAPAPTYIWAGI